MLAHGRPWKIRNRTDEISQGISVLFSRNHILLLLLLLLLLLVSGGLVGHVQSAGTWSV